MNCFILISKDQAKSRGIKYYFTGKPCSRGNIWLRRVSTSNCVCSDCRLIKNAGNKAHYESIKNDPDFKAKVKERTEAMKDWKREYDKEYRERTRDQQNRWSREWCRKNRSKRRAICHNYAAKRRAAEASGISSADLAEWKESQKKICYWCGRKCAKNYHVDHYKPLSRGGLHEFENLVIACGPCNLRKNAKDPYEFAKEVGRLF